MFFVCHVVADSEYLLMANRQFLAEIHWNGSFRNVFRLPSGSNAIGVDFDVR